MALETATFIADLVPTNPISSDLKSQGDDHIRLLKQVLKNTFPNATGPITGAGAVVAKAANFAVVKADAKTTFLVTTGSAITATLPALLVGDAGWEAFFMKVSSNAFPLFIAPSAGTVTSGEIAAVAKARRAIPGFLVRAFWSGSAWFISRVPNVPVGSVLDFHGAALPNGYEWPNGQTLASAATDYPEFSAVNGSGVTVDARGRVVAGKDNMGGVSADRLTNLAGGLDGDVFGATGGSQAHTLVTGEIPSHSHTSSNNLSVTDPGHTHNLIKDGNPAAQITIGTPIGAAPFSGGNPQCGSATLSVASSTTGITIGGSVTVDAAGGGGAHNNVQPTIILNKIICVE